MGLEEATSKEKNEMWEFSRDGIGQRGSMDRRIARSQILPSLIQPPVGLRPCDVSFLHWSTTVIPLLTSLAPSAVVRAEFLVPPWRYCGFQPRSSFDDGAINVKPVKRLWAYVKETFSGGAKETRAMRRRLHK